MRTLHGGRILLGSIGGHIITGKIIPQVRNHSPIGNEDHRQLGVHSGMDGIVPLLEVDTIDQIAIVLPADASIGLSHIADMPQEQTDVIMPQVRLVQDRFHTPQVRPHEAMPQ
eukprot:6394361-Amphidinium_carterae.1